MSKIKTAVLISGKGSNLEALYNASTKSNYPAEISLVISNKKDALGLNFAKEHNIPYFIVSHKDFTSKTDFEKEMATIIDNHNIDIICLAGFMRILTEFFVTKYQTRIINIHPSLLPAFKGGNAIVDAINYGAKITGCTTHFVTTEVDSGKIIMQSAVKIEDHDNIETLKSKIQIQEHIIFPESLKKIALASTTLQHNTHPSPDLTNNSYSK